MFDLSYSASQMKINAINSLEVTCSVFHSVAISTKLLEINYSDLYIKLKMVQKLRYRRGLFQTFAYSYSGVRSIEHTLKSQLSRCYASPDRVTIIFFC